MSLPLIYVSLPSKHYSCIWPLYSTIVYDVSISQYCWQYMFLLDYIFLSFLCVFCYTKIRTAMQFTVFDFSECINERIYNLIQSHRLWISANHSKKCCHTILQKIPKGQKSKRKIYINVLYLFFTSCRRQFEFHS